MSLFGLNPYLAGGALLILASSLSFAGCEHLRAKAAVARAELAEQKAETVLAADESKNETIERQNQALNKWMELGVSRENIAAIVDQVSRYKARTDELAAENNLLRNKDRALPECVALLKISLTQRCPSVAAGLLQLSKDHHQDRTSGDSSSRAGSTATGTH